MSAARRRRLTLAATVLGSSLAFVDATVVVVALPRIEEDLGLGLTGQQWVYLAYSLALASFYLVGGAVGDRYGRRTTFVWGIVGFAGASALAAAAPGEAVLVVARALQGAAGAFLTVNSLALLRATYGSEAGRAIGLWTAFTGVATVAGPPLGGALAEWASWRWIFFVNLPLAAAAVALARAGRCDERAALRVGPMDVPGAALAGVGFGTLTYGLVEGTERGFGSVAWAFAVAAVALAGFALRELRASEPVVPLFLFRRRNFAAANAETFLVYGALGGWLLYLALYLQFIGFTPFQAGLATVPISAIMILLSARMGALADRYGPRRFLVGGPALVSAAVLLFLPVDSTGSFWVFGVPSLLLFAVGLSMLVAPITSTALSSAPNELAGVAAGVNNTVSRLGGLLAVALVGLVVTLVFGAAGGTGVPLAVEGLDEVSRAASVDAFRAGMLLVAGFAAAGTIVGWLGISDEEARARAAASGR